MRYLYQRLLILSAALPVAACIRIYQESAPPVAAVTIRDTYAAPDKARSRKDIVLPASLRTSLEDYRRRTGHWPQTTRALEQESEQGRLALWNMKRRGYELADLLCPHPDTLAVEFVYVTRSNWRPGPADEGVGLGRQLRGRFLFAADTGASVSIWQLLDNTWQANRRKLVGRTLLVAQAAPPAPPAAPRRKAPPATPRKPALPDAPASPR